VAARGTARLAIPGGSAVAAVGALRRGLVERGRWSRVSLTWVDERCVPFASEHSNRGEAYRAGALQAEDPAGFELPLFEDDETPKDAVQRVDRALRREFAGALDVVLLGMGPDGHVASLFPGRRAADPEDLVVAVPDSPKPPPARISLSHAMLERAQTTVLLALGEEKRAALARVIAGEPDLPASGLPGLVVVTDIDPRRTS
jgi:6-phosphogluconolactonase